MNPGPDNKKLAIVKTPIPGKKINNPIFSRDQPTFQKKGQCKETIQYSLHFGNVSPVMLILKKSPSHFKETVKWENLV